MRIEVSSDAVEYQKLVAEFLGRDALGHTVLLTILDNLISGITVEPGHFLSVHDGEKVVGAAAKTASHGVLLGELPAGAVEAVADVLAEIAPDAPDIEAADEDALAFAERWSALRGRRFELDYHTRLYRLGELSVLSAPGRARRAGAADIELCVQWMDAVRAEHGFGLPAQGVQTRVAAGRIWLWEHDGHPVSLVAHHGNVVGWSRVGPVYTPHAERRKGYAGALTAHVSKMLRDKGSGVCLFTDLANPTSNRIYQNIGYEPVRDFVRYKFISNSLPMDS
ncbi:GNAT family N-acetyltransferase [Nocardia sp. NPDC051030]|uniref:GNAT family N-acetyltransferase n=1 Tax=Nocardia sp. NPDC051030 TaxID=3155162 RepID=UPI00344848FD